MKHLFFLVAVLLAACNKPTVSSDLMPIDMYFKVVAVDIDGKFLESKTVRLKMATSKDEDEDHDHHGGCGPLPVTFTSVTAILETIHTAEIKWEIEDEVNVLQYEVKQSIDSKNWSTSRIVLADSSKVYSIIVKI